MKPVLDACCGSRMFWFDKADPRAVFMDNRELEDTLCDGRTLTVNPDIVDDFRDMPFQSGSFALVVFDPPHLVKIGEGAWMAKKYGKLGENWKSDLRHGFAECFRVLKPNGVLVFKWNEEQVPLREVLALTDEKPLFGNKRAKTHWIVFMKGE
ncbi:MAG TPA: class I SAM-dependent methyltransferase [Clostridia bacterium]|nr:class I SAM-dependent methyltransferase [Clostridia bacterium]